MAGGIATAAVMPKSTTPTTPVKTEATDATSTQTGSDTSSSTTPDTTTSTPGNTTTTTNATTTEVAPDPTPVPDPVTVDHQSVRWIVDTSKPQSFLWYCDHYMSDGTMTTLNIGSATEYGNSSGVPKIKYSCPKL